MKTLTAGFVAFLFLVACSGGAGGVAAEEGPRKSDGSFVGNDAGEEASAHASCSNDGSERVMVRTWSHRYQSAGGYTAVVLRSDCRACFKVADDDSTRALKSDQRWRSEFVNGRKLVRLTFDGSSLENYVDLETGALALGGPPGGSDDLYPDPDGRGFTCDGATVTSRR